MRLNYQKLSNFYLKILLLRLVTEIWDFKNNFTTVIDLNLADREYLHGIGLYIVNPDYCKLAQL